MRTTCLQLSFAASLFFCLPVVALEPTLPRFSEEREAAALHFIRKHAPEILPLLEQLKKSNPEQYQMEIRDVFHTTEKLADLDDDSRRELELKIWTTETRAIALAARLSTPSEEERKKIDGELLDLARELAELDIQVLELKSEQLEKELSDVKDELTRSRDQIKENAKARYDELISQAKRRK